MTFVVSPLLLAAGQSTRFGSNKLLHPLSHKGETKPLILHAIMPWLSCFSSVSVIVRDNNLELITTLKSSEFAPCLNLISATAPDTGMSASLLSGIRASQQADAWLIGLADMPFINSTVIEASRIALNGGAAITQPRFNDKPGHPVGFNKEYLSELLALRGDKGAKQILQRYPEQITAISSPDAGIHQDIDLKNSPLLTS
jgi:molybdenum cofactor cytidylyltransferase